MLRTSLLSNLAGYSLSYQYSTDFEAWLPSSPTLFIESAFLIRGNNFIHAKQKYKYQQLWILNILILWLQMSYACFY